MCDKAKDYKKTIALVLAIVLALLYGSAYVYYNLMPEIEVLRHLWYIDFTLNLLRIIGYIILFLFLFILLFVAMFS